MEKLYHLLENARMHNLTQSVLSFGRQRCMLETEAFLLSNATGRVLDVGGGTNRYGHIFKNNYFVLGDLNTAYVSYAKQKDARLNAVVFDATRMPFKKGFFDTIISVGLFHHMSDSDVCRSIDECLAILALNGKLVFIDAFLPHSRYDFIVWFLAKIDRGRYMRALPNFLKVIETKNRSIRFKQIENSYPWNLVGFVINNVEKD